MKKCLLFGFGMLIALLLGVAAVRCFSPGGEERDGGERIIRGCGFVRGIGQVTLRNKYAGFVSKVNFFSQDRVKKGDVILEYDDLDLRQEIETLSNQVLELTESVALKKLELQRTRLDPLPSDYRNARWKLNAARVRKERLEHELNVFNRLYRSRSVSDLSRLEKFQEFKDSEAELESCTRDLEVLNRGLGELYIFIAERELKNVEQELANRKRELALLQEKRKYYRIVAPFDGLCITNSDTVNGYNAAGTDAAVVHCDRSKLVYAYFEERDVGFIVENRPCRFRSNQYDPEQEGYATVVPYEVTKERYSYGDRSLFLVKCRVTKEPKPLRIHSTGQVEIVVPPEKERRCAERMSRRIARDGSLRQ